MPVQPDDPRIQRCGFARLLGLQGDDLDYVVRKYEVTLGRRSKTQELDIVLGDNMNISRKHAVIKYNFEKGGFEVEVLGKNGVTIDGVLHTPQGGPVPLRSRDLIQCGDRTFVFLLPKSEAAQPSRPPLAFNMPRVLSAPVDPAGAAPLHTAPAAYAPPQLPLQQQQQAPAAQAAAQPARVPANDVERHIHQQLEQHLQQLGQQSDKYAELRGVLPTLPGAILEALSVVQQQVAAQQQQQQAAAAAAQQQQPGGGGAGGAVPPGLPDAHPPGA